MDMDKIGRYISECRKERGMTQEELALKLGITAKAVSKWECGKGLPDISIMLDLCYILGINLISLFMGKDSDTEYYVCRIGGSMRKKSVVHHHRQYPKIVDLFEKEITKVGSLKKLDQLVTIEVKVDGFSVEEKNDIIRCSMDVSDDTGMIYVYFKSTQNIDLKHMMKTIDVGQKFRLHGSLDRFELFNKKQFFVKYIQKIE